MSLAKPAATTLANAIGGFVARARNIKPGFYKNYRLADLGPHAQLLFAGLWGLADREGRLEDKPRLIKAEIFPYYDCDVNAVLTELERERFVSRYVVDDIAVIQVLNFKKHQTPHNTEKASILPAQPAGNPHECSVLDNLSELTVDPQKSNDGKTPDSLIHRFTDSLIPDSLIPETAPAKQGATKKPRKPTKVPLPEGFAISDAVQAWAQKGGHQNLQAHFEAFIGKARANGYVYADWDQALQNAIRDDWAKLGQQQLPRAAGPPRQSRHSGFEKIDYSEGIEDGRIT